MVFTKVLLRRLEILYNEIEVVIFLLLFTFLTGLLSARVRLSYLTLSSLKKFSHPYLPYSTLQILQLKKSITLT